MSDNSALVFVPDDSYVWLQAEIVHESSDSHQVEVLVYDDLFKGSDRRRIVNLPIGNLENLPLQNPDGNEEGKADMCALNFQHEAGILHNLNRRFLAKIPYTYSGNVCIAVNPYQWLHLYAAALREQYHRKSRNELPPHIYAISAAAYSSLSRSHINQSILVSGESGAGKTETVKILMGHCAYIASRQGSTTVDKLLNSNPLLESFGNAKTIRNDNSSRFGKYTQLEFNHNHMLVGSKCSTYLLEKTRVVSFSEGERNFHIFYQLLSAPVTLLKQLGFEAASFSYYNYSKLGEKDDVMIETISDGDRFMATYEALHVLGVRDQLRQWLLQILAGILLLGEIQFHKVDTERGESTVELDIVSSKLVHDNLLSCCHVFGVDIERLKKALTWRTINVESQPILVPLTIDQAMSGRDALAKEIYARLFQWLVLVINFNTSYRSTSESDAVGTISLLDIFGFESFAVNRFEQLCINYANEKLQQKFTMDVLLSVQSEYEAEGLHCKPIKIHDNIDVLQLIEGKRGLIQLLNEESVVPKGNDASFFSKLKSAVPFMANASISIGQLDRDQFTIQHYAGKVVYSTLGFMERNRDTLPEDLKQLFLDSKNALLGQLFTQNQHFDSRCEENAASDLNNLPQDQARHLLLLDLPANGKSKSHACQMPSSSRIKTETAVSGKMHRRNSFMLAESVTTKFKSQLTKLMETISATQVQYVRCIKPNTNKSATEFNRLLVVEQLRSAGVVEVVRIARETFPNKISYPEFVRRYRCLKSKHWHHEQHQHHLATGIMDCCAQQMLVAKALLSYVVEKWKSAVTDSKGASSFLCGKTKIYCSAGLLKVLETNRLMELSNYSVRLQSIIRRKLFRSKFVVIKNAAIYLQSIARMKFAQREFKQALYGTIKLQSLVRRRNVYRLVQDLRQNQQVIKIQSLVRMWIQRQLYCRLRNGWIQIQSIGRMFLQRKRFIEELNEFKAKHSMQSQIDYLSLKLQQELERRQEMEMKYVSELYSEKCKFEDERNLKFDLEIKLNQSCLQIEALRSELVAGEIAVHLEKSNTAAVSQQMQLLQDRLEELEKASQAKDIQIEWLKQEIPQLRQELADQQSFSELEIMRKQDEIQQKQCAIMAAETKISHLLQGIHDFECIVSNFQTSEKLLKADIANSSRSEKAACQALLDFSKQSRVREQATSARIKFLQEQLDVVKSNAINCLAGDAVVNAAAQRKPMVDLVEVGIDGLEDDDDVLSVASSVEDAAVSRKMISPHKVAVKMLQQDDSDTDFDTKPLKFSDNYVAVSNNNNLADAEDDVNEGDDENNVDDMDPEDEYELFSKLLAQLQGSISTKDDEIAHLSNLNSNLQEQNAALKKRLTIAEGQVAESKTTAQQAVKDLIVQAKEYELTISSERSLVSVLEAGLNQEQVAVTKLKLELLEVMKALEKAQLNQKELQDRLVVSQRAVHDLTMELEAKKATDAGNIEVVPVLKQRRVSESVLPTAETLEDKHLFPSSINIVTSLYLDNESSVNNSNNNNNNNNNSSLDRRIMDATFVARQATQAISANQLFNEILEQIPRTMVDSIEPDITALSQTSSISIFHEEGSENKDLCVDAPTSGENLCTNRHNATLHDSDVYGDVLIVEATSDNNTSPDLTDVALVEAKVGFNFDSEVEPRNVNNAEPGHNLNEGPEAEGEAEDDAEDEVVIKEPELELADVIIAEPEIDPNDEPEAEDIAEFNVDPDVEPDVEHDVANSEPDDDDVLVENNEDIVDVDLCVAANDANDTDINGTFKTDVAVTPVGVVDIVDDHSQLLNPIVDVVGESMSSVSDTDHASATSMIDSKIISISPTSNSPLVVVDAISSSSENIEVPSSSEPSRYDLDPVTPTMTCTEETTANIEENKDIEVKPIDNASPSFGIPGEIIVDTSKNLENGPPSFSTSGSAFLRNVESVSIRTPTKPSNIARLMIPVAKVSTISKISPNSNSGDTITPSPLNSVDSSRQLLSATTQVNAAELTSQDTMNERSNSRQSNTGSKAMSTVSQGKGSLSSVSINQLVDTGSSSASLSRKRFTESLNIIDKRVLATMTNAGLDAKIFLTSKTGGIVDKPIRINFKKDISRQEASSSETNCIVNDLFECELVGASTESSKKFKFSVNDIKQAKKGKGKTINIKEDDWLCCHLLLDGKGELNLSMTNEEERDSAVKIFRMQLANSAATPSAGPPPFSPMSQMPSASPANVPNMVDKRTQKASNNATSQAKPASSSSNISAQSPKLSSGNPGSGSLPTASPAIVPKMNPSKSASSNKLPVTNSPQTKPLSKVPASRAFPSSSVAAAAPSPASSTSVRTTRAATTASSQQMSVVVPINIIKHGWVQKEDLKVQTKLFKPYQHRYFVLDIESKTLKFASTPKILQFPSQLKGLLKLTADMKVATYKKLIERSLIVEITDSDRKVRLRFVVESIAEQEDWARAFRQVIYECAASGTTTGVTADDDADDDGGDDDVVGDEEDGEAASFAASESEEALDPELETY